MKVLHVINYLSDGGGAEKLMESLLPEIKRHGVDVSVAVLARRDSNNARILARSGVGIIVIGSGSNLYSINKARKLTRIMRQFDIVHAHLTAPFLACAINSQFYKGKLVVTIHNTDSKFRHFPILREIEKWALGKFDKIICCSKDAEISLRNFLGETDKQILTINNGIKLSKFIMAEPLRSMCGPRQINITMVAVFRAQKDHETLIRAVSLLPSNFHLFLVGYGDLESDAKMLAKQCGIESRTHFLGARTDVPNILKASNFVVLSSHYEGLSLSSIEGMSVGVPFIASDVPGLKELVDGYGVLFEAGNAQQLANAIKSLVANKIQYDDIAKRCLCRAKMFDISITAKKYIEVYDSLFKSSRFS